MRRGKVVTAGRPHRDVTRVLAVGALAAGILAGAGPAALTAQTAAAPAPPTAASPPTGHSWAESLDLALSAAAGNASFVIFNVGGSIRRLQTNRYSLELSGATRYGRSDSVEIARRASGALNLDLSPQARWSPFVFVQAEHDRIRKLALRFQGGAGAKYTFIRDSGVEASISLAGLYDYEDHSDGLERTARWSWRIRGQKTFGTLSLRQTTFYQPLWDQPGNYLLHALTEVSTKISAHVALTAAHVYERDSRPPPGVRPDDQTVNVGLRLRF